ncbi:MAG: SOS response-associated peptidase [Verrucomicrobiaceae bacterium]|nr:MAG: SOS response-associated peptidase [Verrucomicrobiaceae bacterium]
MCSAYELGYKKRGSDPGYTPAAEVARILEKEEMRIIRPTIPAPVIMPDQTLRTMLWGFRLPIPGKPGKMRNVFNSREDKLDGRTWNKAFRERRCIIPAAAFYEWTKIGGKKVPLLFERPDHGITWIAGIWRDEEERGECFSMITTEPNEVLAPVHDRMPAVLTDEQIPAYLAGELHIFGPSAVHLAYTLAENFLKKEKDHESPPAQGDLFGS